MDLAGSSLFFMRLISSSYWRFQFPMFSEVVLVRDFIDISVLDKPELIIVSIPKNSDS
jgi:hypothetical protein